MNPSILALVAQHGVPLVAALIFIGEFAIPTGVPAELALLLAGSIAVHSPAALVGSVLLVTVADLLGTTALHLAVRRRGAGLLHRLLGRHAARHDRTMAAIRRRSGGHDVAIVFLVRLLPLVRMSIAIGSGLARFRLRDFVLGAAPAALLWAGTPLTLGYLFRADVAGLMARSAGLTRVLWIAIPALGLAGAAGGWLRAAASRRQRRRGQVVLGAVAAPIGAPLVARGSARAGGAPRVDRSSVASVGNGLVWLGVVAAMGAVVCGLSQRGVAVG